MSKRIDYIIDDIREQYLENDNDIPWIIGFSGGRDSTVVLTLVWKALLSIREEFGDAALARQVYVVNNDTLVEPNSLKSVHLPLPDRHDRSLEDGGISLYCNALLQAGNQFVQSLVLFHSQFFAEPVTVLVDRFR